MLYYLHYLANTWHLLYIFKYISFRATGAAITSFIIGISLAPLVISKLKKLQKNKNTIRQYTPENHIKKKGTPIMGGIIIIIAFMSSTLIWAILSNPYVQIMIWVSIVFFIIGFIDDLIKLTNKKGLSGKKKLLVQIIFSLIAILVTSFFYNKNILFSLYIPFSKDLYIYMGWFFLLFGILVIIGTSNAVNLTDGLDGLAIVPVITVTLVLGIFAYLEGNHIYATYLQLPSIAQIGELSVVSAAIIGASLAFLWYNVSPASIFMGDTGSILLGAQIGMLAILVKQELLLVVCGGIFVIEAMSVILQVTSFKLLGKRIFKIAPLHHHFEKNNLAETKIVVRFWIISIILALVALSTIKIR